MAILFQYDSRDHQQPLTRIGRFALYLFTLACLGFAAYLAYAYFTAWSSEEANWVGKAGWIVAFVLFLLGLGTLVFISTHWFKAGYRQYQIIQLTDQSLRWQFNKAAVQEIPLAELVSVAQDPRHLVLTLRDGQTYWMENYLLSQPEKWDAFLVVARQQLPGGEQIQLGGGLH